MTVQIDWVEAWLDSGLQGHYVLLLQQVLCGKLRIVDPQEQGRLVAEFASYEDAVHWLNEDEYDLMEGRCEIRDDPTL